MAILLFQKSIDFSEAMLEELRKKNVYTKDYCGRLGDNTEPICGIPDGSYDVVVIAGGFAHGHLNIQVLRQAARALKKGTFLFVDQYMLTFKEGSKLC